MIDPKNLFGSDKKDKFAVMILTHKRPNNVITYSTLRKLGYSGKVFFVVDDQDPTVEEYQKNFEKENVLIFSKEQEFLTTDSITNEKNKSSVLYARNACFRLAKEQGFEYFIQLDDDYSGFYYSIRKGEIVSYTKENSINCLDAVFSSLLSFFISCPRITCFGIGQTGDVLGGPLNSQLLKDGISTMRKVMNFFLCSTSRPFSFLGILNDDVNTYLSLSKKGFVFLSLKQCILQQKQTQANAGGLTDLYLESGTYVKSFYSVIIDPSAVSVRFVHSVGRIHHTVKTECVYPKILSEAYRKASLSKKNSS